MCLAVLAFKIDPAQPVLLGANRDEYYDRESRPPAVAGKTVRLIAGTDLRAGGTWLGVNEYGLTVCLTNRHTGHGEESVRRSRGELCRMALEERGAEAAVTRIEQVVKRHRYNAFNLLVIAPDACVSITDWPYFAATPVGPGWHVLGNTWLDDVADVRVRRVDHLLAAGTDMLGNLAGRCCFLEQLCRDHGEHNQPGSDTLCMHGRTAGTRSSSIIGVAKSGRVLVYRHCEGPPCRSAYVDVDIPWQSGRDSD
jgi:hypothetical protein